MVRGISDVREENIPHGKIEWFYRTDKRKYFDSGLLSYLKCTPWINTTKGMKKPGEVFVESQSIKEIFGGRLAYLKDEFSESVMELLGIKKEVTTETVISLLKEFSADNEVDKKLVTKLYTYLYQNGSDYQEEFHENSLIYVPEERRWLKSTEVIWDDASDVLGDLYGWLSPVYDSAKLKEFFVEELSVPDVARTKEYADAWLSLPEAGKDIEGVEKALLQIYPPILKMFKTEEEFPPWYEEFTDTVQVWTQGKTFELPVNVFVRDDGDLARLFKDDVDFVWRPDRYTHGELLGLYESLYIELLSESVTVSLGANTDEIDTNLSPIFPDVSKLLICYMLRSESPDVFEHIHSEGVLEKLLLTNQVEVNSLELVYSFEEYGVERSVDGQNVFLDPDSNRLYVTSGADQQDILDDLAEQLAKIIWERRGFKRHIDTIRRILEIGTEERAKKLQRKKDWHMPADLRKELQEIVNNSLTSFAAQDDLDELAASEHIEDNQITEPSVNAKEFESLESQEGGSAESGIDEIGEYIRVGSTDERDLAVGGLSTDHPTGEQGTYGIDQQHSSQEKTRRGNDAERQQYDSESTDRPGRAQGEYDTDQQHSSKDESHRGSGTERQSHGTGTGRPKSRSSSISKRIKQKNQSRIVSYVLPKEKDEHEQTDEDGLTNTERERIGNLAEDFVLETEIRDGYIAKRMPTNNPGFDVESIDGDTGLVKYIEVKGIDGDWGMRGVGITPTQHAFLKEKEDQAWLHVVENVSSKELRRIHRIKNPIGQIGRYQIDIGWKELDVSREAQTPVTLQDLIEELKELTDEFAGEIIDFCHDNKLTLPEVGYELAGENGAVEAELELAWADCRVGVCATGAPMMDDLAILDGWKLFSMEDVFDQKNILIDELSIPVCIE